MRRLITPSKAEVFIYYAFAGALVLMAGFFFARSVKATVEYCAPGASQGGCFYQPSDSRNECYTPSYTMCNCPGGIAVCEYRDPDNFYSCTTAARPLDGVDCSYPKEVCTCQTQTTCSGGASPGQSRTVSCGSGGCAGSQIETCGSDGNWSTSSSCSTNGNSCSDGNSCTVGDTCSGGACSSGPNSPVNGTCSTFSASCGSWSFTCDAAHCGQTPTRSCTYNLATSASCGGSNPSCGGYTESGATCGACASPTCTAPNSCGTYPNCSAPSGCDNVCGSTKTVDACGTCGGNVSTITCNAPNPTSCGQTTTGFDSCGSPCVKTSPSCGLCTSDTACGDGNICTTDSCINPGTPSSYCTHPTVAGTHSQCSGTTCSSVANTSTSCTGTCTNNTQCGGCVANTGQACNDNNSCTTGETIQCSGACGGGVNVPTSSNWSSWSSWSACSNGSQTRTRTCQGTVTCGGSNNCIGSSTETQSCGTIRCFDGTGCDDNNSCTSDVCINAGTTSSYCTNNVSGTHTVCQSNACVSVVNSISVCANSCSSSANCTSCAANTGTVCNDGNSCTSGETIQCSGACGGGTNTPTDSNWSAWSAWSACSAGSQSRTRTCQGTATCGGTNNCIGSATESRSCTVPNQAICDGAWREIPGGGVTPSQAVGIYVPQTPASGDPSPVFSSQFHDGIVTAVRAIGSSSSIFYQTCLFGGSSTCAFSGTWLDIGALTPYPPALTLGWSLDVRLKDSWNNMYYNINGSGGWSGWQGAFADPGWVEWGKPFRTQDKNGRYWQFARNVYDRVEYSCGPSVCEPLRFNAAASGISNNTVNTGGSFTATCDYGVKGIDSVVVDAPAGITCSPNAGSSFGNANPTSAVFNCSVGGSASSGAVSCRLRNDTSSFTCSQTNIVGNVTVQATQFPTISLSSLTPFSGYSGGPSPASKTLTITNSGSATLNWTAARSGTGTWCSVSPSTGSTPSASSSNVTVLVSAPTNVGTFSDCSIRVSDPNATNNPQTAAVTYTVSTCEAGLTPSSNATVSNITATGYRINWTAFSGNHDNQTRVRIASSLNETGAEQVGTYTGTFAYPSCPQAMGSSPTACVAYTTLAGVQNTYTLSGAAAGTTYYNRLPAICYDKNPDNSNGAMHYKDYVFTASTSGSVCNTSPGTNFMKGCVYDGTNFNTLSNVSLSESSLSSPLGTSGDLVPRKYWALSGPDPSNVDTFSIRWKGTFSFTAGNYVFTAGSDDGKRMYFDDNLDGSPDSGYIINDWVDRGYNPAVVSSPIAVSAGNHTVVFEYYDNGVDSEYSLAWAKQVDPYSLCTGTGSIKRDYWTGIAGNAVSNLTSSANYPGTPSGSTQPTSFEAPTNWADNYGQRMYGLVNAPQTGSYTFYIASDDASELWLSTNSDMANKVRVARVDSYTGSRAWTSFGTQSSGGINLTAGQNYYIEALHKEGGGGDNLAVGWKLPGSSTIDVIPGACLSLYTPPVGTINVRYTLDGVAQNSNQSITYSISGPTAVASASRTVSGSSSHTNMTAGSYTFTYVSGAPGGSQPASSGFITSSATQTLTGGGSITFTLNFVTSAPTGPGTPPGGSPGTPIDADNSTCGVIRLTWSDNSSNETGFKVFRGTTADSAAATLVATTAANATSYTYTPPDTNPYYYFVAATIGGSNDSARIATNALDAPISAVACQANLTGSDKDITAVNGSNTSANACDGAFQGSYIGATAVKFYEGDTISFRINACNTSGQGPATAVSILDTLTNLEQPSNVKMGGSNMAKDADCSTPSVSNHYSYCPATKVVRFYLGTINTGSSANITFDTLISSSSSVASRFNNSSTITYTKDINGTVGSRNANTPWLPYYSSTGVPSRTEVPPE